MARHLHISAVLLTALILMLTMVGCGKTDTPAQSQGSVDAAPAQAVEYKINLESNGEQIAVIELSIKSDTAISRVADMTERFDLKNQRWQHDESKEWVTLSQCDSWATQSKDKSRTSNASVPEHVRAFVEWSLDPKFEIESTQDMLTMTSGQVDYKIAVEKSDGDSNYYRYARLNAYKKAMTERKLPPFAELLVLEELERRRLMPRSMEIQIPGVPGAPSIKMLISRQIAANNAVNRSTHPRGN
jgi:hypothetical protein